MDAIENDNLRENSTTVGNHWMNSLKQLMNKHPMIGERISKYAESVVHKLKSNYSKFYAESVVHKLKSNYSKFSDLNGTSPGDVRGVGLFIGIDLVRNRETREPATEEAQHIISRMKEEFILLSADGPYRNVLKIKPPLVLNQSNADRITSTLDQVLTELKDAEVLLNFIDFQHSMTNLI